MRSFRERRRGGDLPFGFGKGNDWRGKDHPAAGSWTEEIKRGRE